MLSLYSQAQSAAQSVFNFYLTFVTTVVGALVVIAQFAPTTALDLVNKDLTLIALMFFVVTVGSVYLSSISGRYAHSARYARAVDEIRRYLIHQLHIPIPAVYTRFVRIEIKPASSRPRWVSSKLIWLIPTGTYQMFIVIVNSSAAAALTILIGHIGGVQIQGSILPALVVFLLTLSMYNAYSRLTIQQFTSKFHVRVDLGDDMALWAARE